MKYTPGPWKILTTDGAKWPTQGLRESYRIEPEPKSIPEMMNNARLIASSPEMFELLEDLDAVLSTALHNGHHDLIQRVKDLLKKVREG